jgi:hypothetical protein
MTAEEAKALSVSSANALALQDCLRKQKQENEEAVAKRARHQEWERKFETLLRDSITSYAERGLFKVEKTMFSGPLPSCEEYRNFTSTFEFANELSNIQSRLISEGYIVVLLCKNVEHDESSMYLNSGGECGSETIYYTYDVVLQVRWDN